MADAMLFNILSYMNHKLLMNGNTVASIDELYLFFLGEDGTVILDQQIILEHLSEEQQGEIDHINEVCEIISDTFRVYGLPAKNQRKAQTVYVSYLLGREDEPDFYIRLADCFNDASEWMSVYELLGMEFGIVILPEEQQELDERYGITGMP